MPNDFLAQVRSIRSNKEYYLTYSLLVKLEGGRGNIAIQGTACRDGQAGFPQNAG
jgi:hypothetical protein